MSDQEVPSNWAAGLAQGLQQSVAAHNSADEAQAASDAAAAQQEQQQKQLEFQQAKFKADQDDAANQFNFQKSQADLAQKNIEADRTQSALTETQRHKDAVNAATMAMVGKLSIAGMKAFNDGAALRLKNGEGETEAKYNSAQQVLFGNQTNPYDMRAFDPNDPDTQAYMTQKEQEHLAEGMPPSQANAQAFVDGLYFHHAMSSHPAVGAGTGGQPQPVIQPGQMQLAPGSTGANIYANGPAPNQAPVPQPQQPPQSSVSPSVQQAFTNPGNLNPDAVAPQSAAPAAPPQQAQPPVQPVAPTGPQGFLPFTGVAPQPIGPPPTETSQALATNILPPGVTDSRLPLAKAQIDNLGAALDAKRAAALHLQQQTLHEAALNAGTDPLTLARMGALKITGQVQTAMLRLRQNNQTWNQQQTAENDRITNALKVAQTQLANSKANGGNTVTAGDKVNNQLKALTALQTTQTTRIGQVREHLTNIQRVMAIPPDQALAMRNNGDVKEYGTWVDMHRPVGKRPDGSTILAGDQFIGAYQQSLQDLNHLRNRIGTIVGKTSHADDIVRAARNAKKQQPTVAPAPGNANQHPPKHLTPGVQINVGSGATWTPYTQQ